MYSTSVLGQSSRRYRTLGTLTSSNSLGIFKPKVVAMPFSSRCFLFSELEKDLRRLGSSLIFQYLTGDDVVQGLLVAWAIKPLW